MITWADGTPIKSTRFPDNTTQVWHLPEDRLGEVRSTISWDFSSEGEIFEIAQIKDLLEATGTERVYLQIKYLPFARQDKTIHNETTFALHSFAKIINALNFEEIFITDPHSEYALDLINRSQATYPHGLVIDAFGRSASDLVCYPDKGALNKYSRVYPYFGNFIHGEKVRDQATGRIQSYNVVGECKSQRVLIVDDICDGGATFELLARDLYTAGAQVVNLFVTHGIFSKGLRGLYASGIVHIYTAKGEVVPMNDGGIKYLRTK